MLFGEFLGSMFLKIPNGINGLTFAFVIMGCGVMILLYDFLNRSKNENLFITKNISNEKTSRAPEITL